MGILLVKMTAKVNICQHGTATLFLQKTQPRKLSSTHINTNSIYNNLTSAQGFLTWGAPPGRAEINFLTWGAPPGGAEINFRGCWGRTHMWRQKVKGIRLSSLYPYSNQVLANGKGVEQLRHGQKGC